MRQLISIPSFGSRFVESTVMMSFSIEILAPSFLQKSIHASVSEHISGFCIELTPLANSAISRVCIVWLLEAGMSTWPHTEPGKNVLFITLQF